MAPVGADHFRLITSFASIHPSSTCRYASSLSCGAPFTQHTSDYAASRYCPALVGDVIFYRATTAS